MGNVVIVGGWDGQAVTKDMYSFELIQTDLLPCLQTTNLPTPGCRLQANISVMRQTNKQIIRSHTVCPSKYL